MFLTTNEMALRGSEEEINSHNPGLFLKIVEFTTEGLLCEKLLGLHEKEQFDSLYIR